jgi:LacI family transcriptional regulator, galactose operon repressor
MKSVSIFDVADEAGVSIATVSRVINQPEVVKPRTRENVESIIEKLNYRPNPAARALLTKKTNILGLLLPDMHGDFYSEIIRGANLASREKKYHLILSSFSSSQEQAEMAQEFARDRLVDGLIIMITLASKRLLSKLSQIEIPIVVIDKGVKRYQLDNIVVDNFSGACEAVEHLVVDHKINDVFFFGGYKDNIDTQDRLKGYKEILKENSIPIDERKIFFLGYSYNDSAEQTRELKRMLKKGKSAIFAANDEMAIGAIDALLEMGFNVPKDVAVVGFDNIRVAKMTNPPLTTVNFPMSEIGREAVDMILERISGSRKEVKKAIIHARLIVRQSCGCL